MHLSSKPIAALACLLSLPYTTLIKSPEPLKQPVKNSSSQKIQAAILLDVSNSMDGLIEQAKAQLWNMVSVMGKVKCNDNYPPSIEIALYEYGRSNNDEKQGYIKQISAFTTDLDQLSRNLFSLTTYGGDEFCGHVIHTSLNELKWDADSSTYKVIFIAGNEDFLQGNVLWTTACAEARKKNVVVNTIYCGDRMQGIREHWNLNSECGNGSFTNINQDAKMEEIPTPYDTTLIVLNTKLNATYIGYGQARDEKIAMQAEMDRSNMLAGKAAGLKRIAVKGQANLYNNAGWDLVDAVRADSTLIKKIDYKELPANLKDKSRAQLQLFVTEKSVERIEIQKEIARVSVQRDAYIVEEKKNRAGNKESTLETEIEKIIREQVKRYNMQVQ